MDNTGAWAELGKGDKNFDEILEKINSRYKKA
jgi:hypothetical protein